VEQFYAAAVTRSRSRMMSCETARRLFDDVEDDDDRDGVVRQLDGTTPAPM
jgi:hypothetical protein